MENKYYQEQESLIKQLINDEKFDDALKIINEELSMPYIPKKFEDFLISTFDLIPLSKRTDTHSLSLSRIIDLLLRMDKSKNDASDLVKYMSKFNLEEEKEELEYYFSKSTNTRNRSLTFELLIKMKVDIECLGMGNPINSLSIHDDKEYQKDVLDIEEKLKDHSSFIEVAKELLDEVYLTKHIGQNLEGGYADMVIYTTAKIFNINEILDLITDLESVKLKLESFRSFENL